MNRSAFLSTIDGHPYRVVVQVGDDGALRSVFMRRWGKPAGAKCFNFHQFAVHVETESRFGDQLIASQLVASWPDRRAVDGGEFYRAEIDSVRLG